MGVAYDRRSVLKGLAAGSVLTSAGPGVLGSGSALAQRRPGYRGPNVIIVRFGGGVRRQETIVPGASYAPYLLHGLGARGTLFRNVEISSAEGVETSHAQGTLYILTGRYDSYQDVEGELLRERFEPKAPTLFEYLRKAYDVPGHQALIVNGEDRGDEDFLTFSTNNHYGVTYRSNVLSLHQFKAHLLRRQLAEGRMTDEEEIVARAQLADLEARDYRRAAIGEPDGHIEAFWDRWRESYGDTGFVNPRGDRLLTELAVRAIRELEPRLMIVNYQDPDYVHWGNASHYTRAIAVIDQGIKQLVATAESHPAFRENTVFVICPDCGRDDNPFMALPYQHHFGSRSAHEIWTLAFGPGVTRDRVIDTPSDQISVAATVGTIMGFATPMTEGPPLHQALA
ncbi:MAG: hypothetical protein GY791_21060 [Alphaproteobacteria bacterium]|nr:hypothetical protein [Alphaproteobacteria bacterium]